MTYAVNFETTPRVIAVKLSTGGMMHASFGSVQYVNTGKQGIDGTTFYPSVEGDECTLSWTNDGNKDNFGVPVAKVMPLPQQRKPQACQFEGPTRPPGRSWQ